MNEASESTSNMGNTTPDINASLDSIKDGVTSAMNKLRETYFALKAAYDEVEKIQRDSAAPATQDPLDRILEVTTEPQTTKTLGKTTQSQRWMLWPSVSEVLNAPSNLPYGKLSSLLNRVWFAMSSQDYAREDGEAFYNEVRRLNKFSPADLERVHKYLGKYWN